MFNPVDRYRIDLATVVQRASKDRKHETSVDEMVSHFSGLYDEELAAGKSDAQAEASARKRMGSLGKIAFQIVNTPDRVRAGIRIQTAMFILFALSVAAFVIVWSTPVSRENFENLKLVQAWSPPLFLVSGLLAGLGIMMAKRFAWKQFSVCLVILYLASAGIIDSHIGELRMSKAETDDLIAHVAMVEPKVSKVEAMVASINVSVNKDRELFAKDLTSLSALVKANETEFFQVDNSKSGEFLYPSKVVHPPEMAVDYKLTLARTNDLAFAATAWKSTNRLTNIDMDDIGNRKRSFSYWRKFAAIGTTLWQVGFKRGAVMVLACTAVFSLITLLSWMICQLRVVGLGGLRGARA